VPVSGLDLGAVSGRGGVAGTGLVAAHPKQTTSVVAGAVWAPPRPAERAAETLAWTKRSLQVFRELANDSAPECAWRPRWSSGKLTAAESMASAASLIPTYAG